MSYTNVELFASNYKLDKHVLGEGKFKFRIIIITV